jgi:hypothetical protein
MIDLSRNPSMPLRRFAGAVALVWATRLFCSCSFYSPTVSMKIGLPPVPDHWRTAFPVIEYRFVYPEGRSGAVQELSVEGSQWVVLRVAKIPYLPILAYPGLPDTSIELPPAGGIFPLDWEPPDTIRLSWSRGAPAEVLCRLWKQGVDCSAINVPRLCTEMSRRCRGDPWTLALDGICAALGEGFFRATDIRDAPSRDLLLAPGRGVWFLESPFRIPIAADTDGRLLLETVPVGAHILFEMPPETVFVLYVEEEAVLMIPP